MLVKIVKITIDFLKSICYYVFSQSSDSNQKEERKMSKSVYTEAMVQKMRDAAPLNAAKAEALASEFGIVTTRSVIAKAKSEEIEYHKAEKPARKRAQVTKAEKVALIEKAFDVETEVLAGLVKAPVSTVDALLEIANRDS